MKVPASFSVLKLTPPAAVAGFIVFFALGGTAYMGAQYAASPPRQPIAFNHAKHIENGLGCTDCHAGAQNQAKATLPTIDTCLTCHQTPLSSSPEEAKIRSLAAAGQDLQWVQLTQLPPHVFFSHRRHVTSGGLACAECHGPVEKSTVPLARPFRVLTMTTCLDCHQQHGVNSDCNDCHH